MKTVLLIAGLAIPAAGVLFLVWQIRRQDLRGWQHYACLTALVTFLSVLLLSASGHLKSFAYGDAKVEFVEQKAEEVRKLADDVKRIAATTAELSILLRDIPGSGHMTIVADYAALIRLYEQTKVKTTDLLKQAGKQPDEIERTVEPLTKAIQNFQRELENEAATKRKPNP